MRITEKLVNSPEEEGVTLEYIRLTKDFEEIKEYVRHKGDTLIGYRQTKEKVSVRNNSMENARFEVDITCDKKAEQEVFLSQFKRCVEAGAGAVMSSYNSYRGQMCGQNVYLLREVLKEDWQFDGFTLSDFNWGIKDTVTAANSDRCSGKQCSGGRRICLCGYGRAVC